MKIKKKWRWILMSWWKILIYICINSLSLAFQQAIERVMGVHFIGQFWLKASQIWWYFRRVHPYMFRFFFAVFSFFLLIKNIFLALLLYDVSLTLAFANSNFLLFNENFKNFICCLLRYLGAFLRLYSIFNCLLKFKFLPHFWKRFFRRFL